MARDSDTLAFYSREAGAYTSRGQAPNHRYLDTFLAMLPAGGRILELGCGAGQDSEVMITRGFDVRPTNGTAEIAEAAQTRLGRPVATLLFDEISEIEAFDGVWANACLLHVPRPALPQIIANVHRALTAGGLFYASFKAGSEEGRDQFGRYYNYPSENWLKDLYGVTDWADISIRAEQGGGYDGKPTEWLHVMATKRR